MQSLKDFFGVENDGLTDEAVILLRLLGRPFLRPINFQIGEQPSTALVAYLTQNGTRSSKARMKRVSAPFLSLIAGLIGRASEAHHRLDAVTSSIVEKTPQLDRASIAMTTIGILEDAAIVVDDKLLDAVARRLNPLPPLTGAELNVYWHLMLSKFARFTDDEIPLSKQAVLSEEFRSGPIYVIAKTRPFLFVDTVIPFLFSGLKQRAISETPVVTVLNETMSVALARLYVGKGDQRAKIDGSLSLLASQLEVLTQNGKFKRVADVVIGAAAEASLVFNGGRQRSAGHMPFRDVALVEAGLSRGKAKYLTRVLDKREKDLEEELHRYVESVRHKVTTTRGGFPDPILATNLVPYAEGVYFLIWKEVLRRAGIVVDLKPKEWGKTIPHLLQDHLSFAIWNDVVPRTQRKNVEMRVTIQPLLIYDDYPLVVRRDAAEALLPNLPVLERKALVSVLAGRGPLTLAQLRGCPKLLHCLRDLKMGLVGNSDILEVAAATLGAKPIFEHVSSDQAVERLVDGEIAMAVLGGIQSAYLERRFGSTVVTLAHVQRKVGTPVHLWFNEKTFHARQYVKLVPALLEAWHVVYRIWGEVAAAKTQSSQLLEQWIESLAYRLNVGVEGEGGLRTPIEGWSELCALWKTHDKLCEPRRLRKVGSLRPIKLGEAEAKLQSELPARTAESPPMPPGKRDLPEGVSDLAAHRQRQA